MLNIFINIKFDSSKRSFFNFIKCQKKWTADSFEIRPSMTSGAGRGLFSLVYISIEDTIGYYTGKILNNKAF